MSLQISRILHAGYVFECAGTQMAFDPIFENPFSTNGHAFPNVQFDLEKIRQLNFAAVFISHFHDDHCSLDSLNLLNREIPIYLYCQFKELFSWIRDLGFKNVHPIEIGKKIQIGSFEITPHRALDADVDSIFQISAENLNILNVVDSWIDDTTLAKLSRNSPWDMVLWPFQTMRELEVLAPSRAEAAPEKLPEEWTEQLRLLNPRIVVPSSCQFQMEEWSWYNHAFFPVTYRQFQNEIDLALPKAKVLKLNPSASFILEKNSVREAPPLPWIRPIGNQDLDYEYQKDLKPPSTAEISKHLPPLTPKKTERVLNYCHSQIIERYNSLEAPADPFFETSRLWRLSLYDHLGIATHFHYALKLNTLKLVAEGPEEILAWSTEVPISKLYAALEEGESLTSMYMRINDLRLDPLVEQANREADIVEDPLIRCLFTGIFGAYQQAQLKRIKAAFGT